jgi:hypothetical protein
MTDYLMGQTAEGAASSSAAYPDAARHTETEPERNGHIACPVCGFPIGAVRGSKAAICTNCGFKDGCC